MGIDTSSSQTTYTLINGNFSLRRVDARIRRGGPAFRSGVPYQKALRITDKGIYLSGPVKKDGLYGLREGCGKVARRFGPNR